MSASHKETPAFRLMENMKMALHIRIGACFLALDLLKAADERKEYFHKQMTFFMSPAKDPLVCMDFSISSRDVYDRAMSFLNESLKGLASEAGISSRRLVKSFTERGTAQIPAVIAAGDVPGMPSPESGDEDVPVEDMFLSMEKSLPDVLRQKRESLMEDSGFLFEDAGSSLFELLGLLSPSQTRQHEMRLRVRCHDLFDPVCYSVALSTKAKIQEVREAAYMLLGKMTGKNGEAHFSRMPLMDLAVAHRFLRTQNDAFRLALEAVFTVRCPERQSCCRG